MRTQHCTGKEWLGFTQEPPHQEIDRKEPQPPTPPGLEERRGGGEEDNRRDQGKTGERGCEGQRIRKKEIYD